MARSQRLNIAFATYDAALDTARALLEPEGIDYSNRPQSEYARGIVELIADMYPVDGTFMADRKQAVAADLGIAPEYVR